MSHLTATRLARLRAMLDERDDVAAVAARQRLDRGDYGLCVRCGDELPATLLDEAPARGFCEGCEAEQRLDRDRARLGICGIKQT